MAGPASNYGRTPSPKPVASPDAEWHGQMRELPFEEKKALMAETWPWTVAYASSHNGHLSPCTGAFAQKGFQCVCGKPPNQAERAKEAPDAEA